MEDGVWNSFSSALSWFSDASRGSSSPNGNSLSSPALPCDCAGIVLRASEDTRASGCNTVPGTKSGESDILDYDYYLIRYISCSGVRRMPAGLRCSIDIIYGFTVLVVFANYPWIATLCISVLDFKHFEY